MKAVSKQQEILLVLNTSFSSGNWIYKSQVDTNKKLTKKERLKQACWNGLAPILLPECFIDGFDSSMILWEVNDGNGFIDLEYGEHSPGVEIHKSVNPYLFMRIRCFN